MTMPSSSSSQPNLNKAQSNDNDDDDDDDDDIFSGSSQLAKPMTAVNMNAKSASLTNLKANNSGNSLEKQANLDYTDDISFNDDYGDENEDEERMLKTKNFGNTLKSNQRGQETTKKVVVNTQAPPKPVPRKKYAEQEDDDDDSDQNVDDYGDEEEEDDDKF